MKKIIFSLCLIVVFVFSIVSIPKAYALPQEERDTWYNRMLLVGNNDTDTHLYFLLSEYEYSKQTAWRFYDYWHGELFVFDYLIFGDYTTTLNAYISDNIISVIGFGGSNDGNYYLIDLYNYSLRYNYSLPNVSSWYSDTMGACTYVGTYEHYNVNGVVLVNSHTYTGTRKNGLSINDVLYLSVETYARYYEDTIDNLDIEDIEQESWKKGVIYGVEYAYNQGFGPFHPELGTTNQGSYSYKLGKEDGQATNFNGFQLILGFFFAAIGLIGSIEILPALPIWYVIGIPIVFGLIFFVTGKGKK